MILLFPHANMRVHLLLEEPLFHFVVARVMGCERAHSHL
jgi:hypothetical protein